MPSMFSDEEFEGMRTAVESMNPGMLSDVEDVQRKIAELDASRAKFAGKALDMEIAPAIHILLQGRNFLARCIGEPEVPVPDDVARIVAGEEPKQEIDDKHVAVFIEKALLPALAKAYGLIEDLRYETYTELNALVKAVAMGKVCGVVAIQVDQTRRIENSIRHDLKSLPGWNIERASSVALPPCADVIIHQIMLGVSAIIQMKKGAYQKPEDDQKFDLAESLPNLAARMKVPSSPVRVLIVDDEPKTIEGMMAILNAWSMVTATALIQSGNQEPTLPDSDIYLLDEAMGQVTGSMIASSIKKIDARTIVASTTSGSKPTYAKWHFASKGSITTAYQCAVGFVNFVNELIVTHEAK